ncbi:hypothetical protein J7K50_05220 [bacterium]|nr:hypothetical protein [bacterium]
MTFTEAAKTALEKRSKKVVFRVLLKTSHPESSAFEEFTLREGGFRLTREAGLPARLELSPIPPDGGFGAENDPSNRWQLFARVELWCDVYLSSESYESERLFDGIVTEIEPQNEGLYAVALDRMHILSRTVCEVNLDADTVVIADGSPLAQAAEFDQLTYGLDINITPDGFSPSGARRSFRPGDIRVYNPSGDEVPPGAYTVYPDSGVVRFNTTPQGTFTINGVHCYIEGTNDVSDVMMAALIYPKDSGGPGIDAGEIAFENLGLDLNRVRWKNTDGCVLDLLNHVKESTPGNIALYYNSAAGQFKLELVEQKETPDYDLINPIRVNGPRSAHEVFTRVVLHGDFANAKPLTDDATVTDLLAGVGDIFKWDGNKKVFDVGSIGLVTDGNANSGFGRHNLTGDPYDWRNFAKIDLGVPPGGGLYRVSRIDIVAANSHNPNSQSASNKLFLYGVDLLGSLDDASYVRISPEAKMYLKALEVRTLESITFDRFRYLKIRIKPAKDGLSNENDPGIALNEIRIYGSMEFRAEAAVQDTDPNADFYYPDLVEKTAQVGHLTYIEDTGGALDRYAADERAAALLDEFIRSFQRVEYRCIIDPTIRVHATAGINDSATGLENSILVEKIVIEGETTIVCGTNYLAAPLS